MKFKKLNENIGYGLDKIKDPILFDTNGLDKETIEVLRYLDHEGYDANAKDVRNYADAVAEYIDMVRSTGEDYSVADWYRDTTENYPEELSDLSIRDYDYNDTVSESLSEAYYVLDNEEDWALDNKLVRTDLYTKVYGGKLSHVFKSEIDGRLYALELDPSAEGYRYVGTFPEYCEKITPEITQRIVTQRMLESVDQGDGWEDLEWRKYWGVDDDSFYDDYNEEPLEESLASEEAFRNIEERLAETCQEADGHSFEFEAEFPVAEMNKFAYDLLEKYNITDYDVIDSNTFTSKDGEKWYYFYGILHPFSEIYDENGAEWGYKYESLGETYNNTEDIKHLQNRLAEINKAIENGDDPERWSKLKERIMDKLDKLGAKYYDESLSEWYDQYEPDQNYMYDQNYFEYVYDIETAAENAGRTDRLAGDKLKTKEEFLSTFDTSYDDRPEDEQDDEVLYFYYKKGYNKKRKFKDGRVYPALDESLIDPTQEDIEAFEEIVAYNDFDIEKKGNTLFGNIHYQIIDHQGAEINSQEALRERIKNFIEDIDKFEEDYNIPVTWNFGTNDEGILTAGIDLREKFVDDEDLELTTDDLNAGQWYESLDKSLKENYSLKKGDLVKITGPTVTNHPLSTGSKEYIGKIGKITYIGSQFNSYDTAAVEFDNGKECYFNISSLVPTNESLKEDKEVLYIIKDRQGNQLSRPNPDDNELWDRVDSMDPYGKKGYRVVVYTGESLFEDTQNNKYRLVKKYKGVSIVSTGAPFNSPFTNYIFVYKGKPFGLGANTIEEAEKEIDKFEREKRYMFKESLTEDTIK